jgi:predicted PurR-regulated permease PerM
MDRTGAARIVWTAGAVVLAVVLFDVLLLAFAGVLFAVFLRTLSGALSKHTRLPAGWAVLIVLVVLAGATAAILWWVAPDIAREIDLLIADVPKLVEGVTASLESYAWGRWLLDQGGSATAWLTEPGTVRRATSLVGSTIGLVGAGLVILLAGIFIAAEPRPYREGVLRLVPVDRRGKARELLDDLGRVLRAWLLGKVIAMAVIFAVTWAGLSLLGIPIASTLALLAAALTFIPNFGPVLAAIPAVLLGLQQGTTTALAVAGLYAGAQAVESYVLTPLIQRKAVSLPPALTLLAQVAMGIVAGGVGLLLATPLTAAVLTIARGVTPPLDREASPGGAAGG